MQPFSRRLVALTLCALLVPLLAAVTNDPGWAQVPPKPKPGIADKPSASVPAAIAPPALPSQPPRDTVSSASQIQPPAAGYRFPNGQTLSYTAAWHLFTAGKATLRMEPVGPLQKVTVEADSVGVVNLLFGVHDRFQATFDPKTFCSLSVFKHSEEGLHRRETQIHFEYSRRKSVLEEKNLKTGEQKRVEHDILNCNTDVITGIFYLGSLSLREGSIHIFPVADGSGTTTAISHVEGKERVKTPAGTFDTVRVGVEATDEPLKSKGKAWIWYTDDAAHMPVQMRARLGWGSLVLMLQPSQETAPPQATEKPAK